MYLYKKSELKEYPQFHDAILLCEYMGLQWKSIYMDREGELAISFKGKLFKSMADAIESGKNWIRARIEECKLCPSPYIDEETLREIVEDGRLEINHYDDSADLTYADKDDDSEPYFFVDIIELPLRTEKVNYTPFNPYQNM